MIAGTTLPAKARPTATGTHTRAVPTEGMIEVRHVSSPRTNALGTPNAKYAMVTTPLEQGQ